MGNTSTTPAHPPSCSAGEQHQHQHQQQDKAHSGCPVAKQGHFRVDTEPKDGLDPRGLTSSIPKAGTDGENWVYPSPQRFYNAMLKKGWTPNKEDIPTALSIHNTVNERCWQQILEYEKLHEKSDILFLSADSPRTCCEPKLLRFRGRPKDYSPKARLLHLMGYILPFDRHDWIVDRCGKEVRYIIDFYRGKQDNPDFPISIYLDVRPELSVGGAVDRVRLYFRKKFKQGKEG